MATGDSNDIVSRVKRLIPNRWFAYTAPIRDAVLGGLADIVSWCYNWQVYARLQSRLATATDLWLDVWCYDFLGRALSRQGSTDNVFRATIQATILKERVTRKGMSNAVTTLTGNVPWIFEPWNTFDTGAYSSLGQIGSTNYLLWSQYYANLVGWNWSAILGVTTNATTAPDGTLTASLIVPNTTSTASHDINQLAQAVTAGTPVTFSIYLKPGGYNFAQVRFGNSGFTAACQIQVNLSNGTFNTPTNFGSGAVLVAGSVQSASNGFYRVLITGYVTGVTNYECSVYVANAITDTAYAGDGVSGVYAWGAQLEPAIVNVGSSNLVQNGNFSLNPLSASQSTLQNSWEWTNFSGTGTPSWSGGVVTLTPGGGHVVSLVQSITTIVGQQYLIQVDVGTNSIAVSVGTTAFNNNVFSTTLTVGTGQQCAFTATTTTSYLQLANQGLVVSTIDNISVLSISTPSSATNYLPTTTTINSVAAVPPNSCGGQMGYGQGKGGYGAMYLPGQVFMKVTRSAPSGVPQVGGYGSYAGGYKGSDVVSGQVGQVGQIEFIGSYTRLIGITDQIIENLIVYTKPSGVTVWMQFV